MTKKFSQFTAQLTVLLTDELVGLKSSDNMKATIQVIKDAINSAGGTVTGDVEIVGAHKAQTYQGNGALITAVPSAGVGGSSSESSLTLLCNSGNANPLSKVVASKFSVDLFEADENGFVLKSSIPYSHEDAAIPFDKDLKLQGKELLQSQTILNMQPGPSAVGNGSTSKIIIPNSNELQIGTGDGSFVFGVKTPKGANYSASNVLFDKRTGAGNGYQCLINSNNKVEFAFDDGGSIVILNDSVINDGEWHWFDVVADRDGVLSMTQDGILQADTAAMSANDSNDTTNLYLFNDTTSSFGFDGEFILKGILNRAHTAAEAVKHTASQQVAFDPADEGASNVEILTAPDLAFSTDVANAAAFNSAYVWSVTGTITIAVVSNVLTTTGSLTSQGLLGWLNLTPANRYRLILQIDSLTNDINIGTGATNYAVITTPGLKIIEFIAVTAQVHMRPNADVSTSVVVNASAINNSITQIGIIARYLPPDLVFDSDGNALYWKDSSGNSNHGAGTDVKGANISEQLQQMDGTFTPSNGDFGTWTAPTFTAVTRKIGGKIEMVITQTGGTIDPGAAGKYFNALSYTPAYKVTGFASNASFANLGGVILLTDGKLYFTDDTGPQTTLTLSLTFTTND